MGASARAQLRLVRLADRLNRLHARREALGRLLLHEVMTMPVPRIRQLKRELVRVAHTIARLEARLK